MAYIQCVGGFTRLIVCWTSVCTPTLITLSWCPGLGRLLALLRLAPGPALADLGFF